MSIHAGRSLRVAVFLALWSASAMATGQDPGAGAAQEETRRERMDKEVEEAVEAIRAYSAEQRDEAMERAQASMAEIDRRIDALQDDMDRRRDGMDDAARDRSREAMSDLRQRRQRLSDWYDRMRHGSGKAWSDVKEGFAGSYRALSEALRKARDEFEEEAAPAEGDDGKGGPA
jgi:hypothetical protein